MSKPANKTMIGAFVLGAVVLAVVAIVIFGSGRFFKDTSKRFCYFQGSVKGLNVGSPVVFRGVQVGEVTDIIVNFDSTKMQAYIPVFFETYSDKFREIGPEVVVSESAFHHALVSKGLRAQLQMQSLVTGQLVINVDFLPDTPAKLQGVQLAGPGKKIESWWEIPTIPTPLQRLESALAEISFKEIAEDVRRAMDGIAKLATSPDLHASIGELRQTMTDIQKLVRNIDSKVEPLATGIDQTLVEVRAGIDQTLVEVRAGIGDARKLMRSNIKEAADSATTALDQANVTLKSIEDIAEEGTQLRYDISAALKEIAAAARSVRVLADFIEQHPDAILRGRVTKTGGQ
ncbi:MAG: MCE family protein [Desulfobacterales bacterium]|nr:MCE family protein [Desulfobacterales bacterium]